jgi:hypothetical protein
MKTYKLITEVTEEEIKKAEQWKALADKHNLSLEELDELTFYVSKIKELLNKGKMKNTEQI